MVSVSCSFHADVCSAKSCVNNDDSPQNSAAALTVRSCVEKFVSSLKLRQQTLHLLWKSTQFSWNCTFQVVVRRKMKWLQVYIVYDESKRKSKGGESPGTEISPRRKELLQVTTFSSIIFHCVAECWAEFSWFPESAQNTQ